MKLTPLDIHHKEFRRALRGYNEEDVDVFLDEVAEEFERLFKENIELKEQVEETKEKIQQYEGIEDTLQKTLLTAQKSAEEVKNKAVQEAEIITKDAEAKARETLQDIMKEKEKLQVSFEDLKKAEQDFRGKFRSLLESFLTMVNEIEGGIATKRESKAARVTEEQPREKKGKEEEELAKLLKEIKMAKNEMAKGSIGKKEESGDLSADETEAGEIEVDELAEEEERVAVKPKAKKGFFGKKKNPEDEIEEIS